MESLLVLTGVSRPADLVCAVAEQRPTYVAMDLHGLFEAGQPVASGAPDSGWRVDLDGAAWVLDGSGSVVDALRALCAAVWSHDGASNSGDGDRSEHREDVAVASGSARAGQALVQLGLAAS